MTANNPQTLKDLDNQEIEHDISTLGIKLNERINFPLPKGVTIETRPYGYWLGLQEILNKAFFNEVMTADQIKDIYFNFGKIPTSEMRFYIKTLDGEINNAIFNKDLILSKVTENETVSKIREFLTHFPAQFHEEIYNFLITGEEPRESFFDDIEYAMEHPGSEFLEEGVPSYDYQNYDPEAVMDALRDRNFTLEDSSNKKTVPNTKPVTPAELEKLLNSTNEITSELSDNTFADASNKINGLKSFSPVVKPLNQAGPKISVKNKLQEIHKLNTKNL